MKTILRKKVKHTYTYVCPTCNTTRQLGTDPKYNKTTGNIRKCRKCSFKLRPTPDKYEIKETSVLYNNCVRTMSDVSRLTGYTKPTIASIETKALRSLLDHIAEELRIEPIKVGRLKGDPIRRTLQRFLMDHYTEHGDDGYNVEAVVEALRVHKPKHIRRKNNADV